MTTQSIWQGQIGADPWADLPRTPSGRRGSRFWRVKVHRWTQTAQLGLPVARYVFVAVAVLLAALLVTVLVHDLVVALQSTPVPQPSSPGGSGPVGGYVKYVKAPRSVFYDGPRFFWEEESTLWLVSILLVVVAVLALILGSVGAMRKRSRIRFYRSWGIIGRGDKVHKELLVGLAIPSVVAVQVCSGYGLFEMNLVVPSVSGWRVPLVCHSREKTLRQDARLLAAFLRVPLLDHTEAGATALHD